MNNQPECIETIEFAKGVEKRVRTRFPDALFTTIPANNTLASLEQAGLKFIFPEDFTINEENLGPGLTVASRAVYFTRPLDGSFLEAFDDEEENEFRMRRMDGPVSDSLRENVHRLANKAPQIPGVRWEIPSEIILAGILFDHWKSRGEYLLPKKNVWTSDMQELPSHDSVHLITGNYSEKGLNIKYLPGDPVSVERKAWVFIVGFPDHLVSLRGSLRLVP